MNSALYKEVLDFATFLKAVLLCGFYMGLPVSLGILFAYESVTKRRI